MSKLTVCLTFDVDGMSSWIGTSKTNNPSMISRGEFTVVATPRILDLLKRKGVRGTFCIPGATIYAFPDLAKRIRDDGHELVHHGWIHENPADFNEAGERELLENGLVAFDRVLGIRPIGYRSPAWDLSAHSINLLRDKGFLYDSSCMGSDFTAYYLRTGDTWSLTDLYRFGETTDLVELPVNWALDDLPAFETILGFNGGYRSPRQIEEMWRDDFDFALARCSGGIFTITMHPEVIGRGSRLQMLERLIDHMAAQDGVTFAAMHDYAEAWKKQNPLKGWKQENPLRTGINAISTF